MYRQRRVRPVRISTIQETHRRIPAEALAVTSRTTQTVVRFSSPFRLPGFDGTQPAGEYRVDYDEELIDGVSRLAWRRVGAFIHLPAIAAQSSTLQMMPIHPSDLETALEQDHQQS
jgi:hypothetical protein